VRKLYLSLAALLALFIVSPHLVAQEATKSETKKPAATLKIQVVFTENEGDKKVANLPYTFFVSAGPSPDPWTKIRVGSRVPVATGTTSGQIQLQYIDVGTNLDGRAYVSEEGRYDVQLSVERSWVEGDVIVPTTGAAGTGNDLKPGTFKEPIIRQFKTNLELTMRDGQTMQTTQAADPLSGRLLAISVTMNVVK
jgi:hypothetical protein